MSLHLNESDRFVSSQSWLFQDKETRDFIYEFIERHGGVDAALMEEDGRFGQAPQQPGAAFSAGNESIQISMVVIN